MQIKYLQKIIYKICKLLGFSELINNTISPLVFGIDYRAYKKSDFCKPVF